MSVWPSAAAASALFSSGGSPHPLILCSSVLIALRMVFPGTVIVWHAALFFVDVSAHCGRRHPWRWFERPPATCAPAGWRRLVPLQHGSAVSCCIRHVDRRHSSRLLRAGREQYGGGTSALARFAENERRSRSLEQNRSRVPVRFGSATCAPRKPVEQQTPVFPAGSFGHGLPVGSSARGLLGR